MSISNINFTNIINTKREASVKQNYLSQGKADDFKSALYNADKRNSSALDKPKETNTSSSAKTIVKEQRNDAKEALKDVDNGADKSELKNGEATESNVVKDKSYTQEKNSEAGNGDVTDKDGTVKKNDDVKTSDVTAKDADVNAKIESKVSEIQKILEDPKLKDDIKLQDQLLKMLLQLQGLMSSNNATLNITDDFKVKLDEILNSPIVASIKTQDKLMNEVVSELTDKLSTLTVSLSDASSAKNQKIVSTSPIDTNNAEEVINDNAKTISKSNDVGLNKDTALTTVKVAKNPVSNNNEIKGNVLNNNISNAEELKTDSQNKEILGTQVSAEFVEAKDLTKQSKNNSNSNLLNKQSITQNGIESLLKDDDLVAENEQSFKEEVKSALKSAIVSEKTETKKTVLEHKAESIKSDFSVDTDKLNLLNNVKNEIQQNTLKNIQNVKNQASVNYKDVIEQVANGTKLAISGDNAEMTIKLSPENLGKISLKIATENGIVTAKFVAESQQVKETIEANFNTLKDSLQQQGINIGSLSVSVGSEDRNLREQMYNSSNKKKFRSDDEIQALEGFDEDVYVETNSDNYLYPESSVSYKV